MAEPSLTSFFCLSCHVPSEHTISICVCQSTCVDLDSKMTPNGVQVRMIPSRRVESLISKAHMIGGLLAMA